MLRRHVLLVRSVAAGCLAIGTVPASVVAQTTVAPVWMNTPAVRTEPLPPLPVVPLPASALPGFDFDLPPTGDSPQLPVYHEQPIKPAQLPLRLEIKLSRRRVTVYRGATAIKTYAIAVGRPGWETPKGTYKVKQMFRNPTWVHPLKKGITIPGGDPENPLGRYWIGFWTDGKNWIGFHGTPNPQSVGTAVSHGCVRMYDKDIEELFSKVSLGTEVKVVQ